MKFKCPKCNSDMVLREGLTKFYGCTEFRYTVCTGKRDLMGNEITFDSDTNIRNNRNSRNNSNDSSSMYDICRREGYTDSEARFISDQWEWQEENDSDYWKD